MSEITERQAPDFIHRFLPAPRQDSPLLLAFHGHGGNESALVVLASFLAPAAQPTRGFVDKLDFTTTPGHVEGGAARAGLGLRGAGPSLIITDPGLLEPDAESRELTLTSIHPGVDLDDVRGRTGWDLRIRSPLPVTEPPTADELRALREL